MEQEILDPLEEYKSTFAPRFKDICEQTFNEIAEEAKIDQAANKDTCLKIYENEEQLNQTKKRLSKWTAACWILWAASGIGLVAVILGLSSGSFSGWLIALIITAVAGFLVVLFTKVHPSMKRLKSEREVVERIIKGLQDAAWAQMEPLFKLYDWDIFARMMSRTLPNMEFDPYFTTQRLADLQHVYGWTGEFNDGRSVIYSHSGLINGNPFVLCRTRKMEWGSKTYHGERTITWTTTERDADGKTYTEHHSETLHASYTAPYPEYPELTRLIYGNTAAPTLVFNRIHSNLAGKNKSIRYKATKHILRKKSENLDHADYAMMSNEDFEVAFNTSDRSSNQQFALLFTPLAQNNIMALLTDKETGYGDDFDFHKNGMINTVVAEHMQCLSLDMDPRRLFHFDFDKAKEIFQSTNANYFRAIYFNLAPLLCVPMYQQIRPLHEIYGRDMMQESSFWEHESLANAWGESYFSHPDCVTSCILKTRQQHNHDGSSTLYVTASGFRKEPRLTYVSVHGGDGRNHDVPVDWDEYISVIGEGAILMREDNQPLPTDATQTQHVEHINQILSNSGLVFYRRHIASRLL